MSLLTTIALTIGGAIVKHVTAGYLGDGPKSQVAQDLLDLVRDQLGDGLTARPEQRPIEQVAQQVAQKLLPLFAQESRHLEPATREAITLAVARTLMTSKIDADLLLQQRLDPARLANTLIAKAPESSAAFSPDETALYRRLLTESCRQLVGIANHFAGYEILVDRRLLTGQDEVLAQLARLLAEPDKQSRDYADAYCAQLSKQLNKFEQIGIDYAQRATDRQPLAVAYVALRLMQGDGSSYEELPARHARRYQQDDGFEAERPRRTIGSIQEMLAYAPRLVIQGQPGSGKSTLLRWLAIQIAQRSLSRDYPALASWDECIPFYIQLRTFVNKPLPTPSEWPTHQVRQLALKPPDIWMHEVLSDGRAVVLIDGVDETPEGQRVELLQWLQEVMNAYPWARYIITSRPAAIKLWPEWIDWSRSSGFLTLSLQEMELEQSFHFIEQWHNALQQSLPDAAQREEVAALAEPLKQLVRQRDALRRLARNPLLCSMICALHREHPHTMPQNRIKLYQDCVEMLMHRRDAERKVGSLADYPPLSNIHEEVALRDYAHHLMLNGESEEDLRDADHYFDELLQRINLPGWSGERLRHYFVARTGLLFEPAEGRIAFTHRTFQEFLAAREIVKKNEIRMLLNKARDDQWRETILLTIGIPEIDPNQSDRLLNGLLNKADELTTPRYRHELYLLAVACLETAIYLTPPMRRHILAKAATLIPPRNDDAVALIAKGGDPIIELLRFNPNYSFRKMARCVEALIAIGSELALTAIVEYAISSPYEHEKAWYLRRAVARGLFIFDPIYYCQRVLAHVRIFDLSVSQASDMELMYLRSMPHLHSLDLSKGIISDMEVSDEGLVHLQSLTALKSLNLSDLQVSDKGLIYVQNLTRLESLDLSGTQISDAGLVCLQALTKLRSLNLSGGIFSDLKVSDTGLIHLRCLPMLQSLELSDSLISNAGLIYLQGLVTLQSLNLSRTQISNAGLVHIQHLTSLKSLDLSKTWVSDTGVLYLQRLTVLQSLNLGGTQISDAGMVYLQSLTTLQSLDINSTQIGDAGLVHLQSLIGLHSLNLNSTQTGDAGLAHLQALTKLQSLTLRNTCVSDTGLAYLRVFISLQSLSLSFTKISDDGLVYLQGLTNLQSLDLSHTHVSDAGLIYLQSLTNLQSLNLRDTQVKNTSVLNHLLGLDIEL